MKNIFLVDADDTILDFHGVSAIALKNTFEENGMPWKEEYLTEFKKINSGLWAALERKELTREKLMNTRFDIYLAHMGFCDIDGKKFNESFLRYLSEHPRYLKGAEAFLRTLRTLGRVYIVTNGTAWIQKKRFDIAGLWDYADDTFISEKVGYDKPAKEYTEYVISHIPDFKKDRAVWIGDSLSADMKAATEAEITGIWFNPANNPCKEEVKIEYIASNFEEILEILYRINEK